MLSDQSEHRCQVTGISRDGVALRTPIRGSVGETVLCYLDQFGRLEGRVARLLDDGFAFELAGSEARRAQLVARFAAAPVAAEHRHDRIEPLRRRVVLKLADGRQIATSVINLSRSGAALTCPLPLAVGDAVTLGRRPARVIRSQQRLLAVEFAAMIGDEEFGVDIIL